MLDKVLLSLFPDETKKQISLVEEQRMHSKVVNISLLQMKSARIRRQATTSAQKQRDSTFPAHPADGRPDQRDAL
jgi:hypothetical protein